MSMFRSKLRRSCVGYFESVMIPERLVFWRLEIDLLFVTGSCVLRSCRLAKARSTDVGSLAGKVSSTAGSRIISADESGVISFTGNLSPCK